MKPRSDEHKTQTQGGKKSKQVMERDEMLYTCLYIRYYLHKYLSSGNIHDTQQKLVLTSEVSNLSITIIISFAFSRSALQNQQLNLYIAVTRACRFTLAGTNVPGNCSVDE